MVLNDCSVALTLERICTPSFPVWCCCKISGRKGGWARPRGMNYFHNVFGSHVLFGQELVVPGHGVIQLRPQMIRTGARHVAPLHSSFLAICAPCCCKPSGGKSFGANVLDEDCSSAPRPGCALPHPEHEETNRVRKLIRSRSRNKNMTGVTRIYMNPNRIPEAGGFLVSRVAGVGVIWVRPPFRGSPPRKPFWSKSV